VKVKLDVESWSTYPSGSDSLCGTTGPGRERFSARNESSRMKVYLIEDFHEVLGFCWGERRRGV